MMLMTGLALVPRAVASADEPPDTTPPQIDLNPCYGEETSCRRVYAEVFGNLEPGDDLAVLGARIGDTVVEEHVYDDGTGFVPHGWFISYGNDVYTEVDYALSIEVPRGTTDLTFYARDLEGNTSELTTMVLGPIPPGPVPRLRANLVGGRSARVAWGQPALHTSCCPRYVVRTPRRPPRWTRVGPPGGFILGETYRRLSPGWHRFTVRTHTEGGVGPARTVRLFVPRQSR
ncbi:hypothetical protein SAMN05192576_0868 [Nocardioides szechwanensis]|uniref:Fibronectin type-III domain-containing protein n=2 Tax=Nocardioides szechwanensis TaxID=1005944 RepID=A0A1G9VUL8_9ACTN|nr:hypothetical protein SAMN05192576_0868 [Nocardioides szechwanensis]